MAKHFWGPVVAALIIALPAIVALLARQTPAAEAPAPAPPQVVVIDNSRAEQLREAEAERAHCRRELECLREGQNAKALLLSSPQRARPDKRPPDLPRPQDPGQQPPPQRRQEKPPEPPDEPNPDPEPAEQALFDVAITVALENIKLRDSYRPLQALGETVRINLGGHSLCLDLSAGEDKATKTVRLPLGAHRYTATTQGRTRWFPGNGHSPRTFEVAGKGSGQLVVKGDAHFVLKRGVSEKFCYDVTLEQSK